MSTYYPGGGLFYGMETDDLVEYHRQAVEAYRRIVSGGGLAAVRDQNGEEVRYSRANIDELRRYINDLAAELALRRGEFGGPSIAQVWIPPQ